MYTRYEAPDIKSYMQGNQNQVFEGICKYKDISDAGLADIHQLLKTGNSIRSSTRRKSRPNILRPSSLSSKHQAVELKVRNFSRDAVGLVVGVVWIVRELSHNNIPDIVPQAELCWRKVHLAFVVMLSERVNC